MLDRGNDHFKIPGRDPQQLADRIYGGTLTSSAYTRDARAKRTPISISTPPDYAYAANWIAHVGPGDHVLEPSAGVGGLIVHAMTSGARETTANELSDKPGA